VNAADVLDRELPSRPAYRLSFVAMLVHRPIPSVAIRKLRDCRVRFRGVPYSISSGAAPNSADLGPAAEGGWPSPAHVGRCRVGCGHGCG
jgi:hypothetical protein